MKVELELKNGLKGVFEGSPKEVFRQLADFQDGFSNDVCGACHGKKGAGVRFVVREVDEYEFFEMHCQDMDCRAKLSFGISNDKKENVYPKRAEVGSKGKVVKDDNGKTKYLPNNGWVKFVPGT